MYDGIEFMAVECFRLRLFDRGCCNVLVNYQLLIENLKLKENSPKPPRAGKLHDDFSFFFLPRALFVLKTFIFWLNYKNERSNFVLNFMLALESGE